jgi:hypothetical protein
MQTEGLDAESGAVVPLFKPRQDDWYRHFAWTADGLRVLGLTPVGRATIVALQMNNLSIRRARQVWVSSGWHPKLRAR